jgi:hypothetical protein
MRSRGGMLVVAKMDKVNIANIQTMIDKHADANATLCTYEASINVLMVFVYCVIVAP